MNVPSISIAQGLGPQAGELFAQSIRTALNIRGLAADINLPWFDAAEVINALCDERQLAEIMLFGLTTSPGRSSDVVLIPCNSVHIATPYIKSSLGERFIAIDQAVITSILQAGLKGRFLILGTSATLQSGIYQNGLSLIGCESVGLPSRVQVEFDQFIFNELVSGEMKEAHLHWFRLLESQYKYLLSADYVVLACTELCYLVQTFSDALPWEIDSMQALVDAGVERLRQISLATASHAH